MLLSLFIANIAYYYTTDMTSVKNIIISILLFLPALLAAQEEFPLPDVPRTLKGAEARANYLSLHYWDRFDFKDNTLIGNKDISEQGFSNFISIMPYVSEKEAAFEALASRLASNSRMLQYFLGIGIKYLAEPMSPVYNEGLYIMFLEKIVAQEGISERDYEEANFDLTQAKKNRIGTKATDFTFMKRNGRHDKLSNVKGEHILLFFGDPECDICITVKNEMKVSPLLSRLIDSGRLTVLSVCVEGKTDAWKETPAPQKWIDACDDKQVIYGKNLYDIPGLPVLYLLDKEHKVIMKNVQLQHIEQYFGVQ